MNTAESFCTAQAGPEHRVRYWNDLLCARLAPVEVVPLAPSDYCGSLRCFGIGRFQLAQATSAPAYVCNAETECQPNFLNLSFQIRGRTVSTTAGTTTILGPSDFVLYDPWLALSSRFTETNQTLVLRIPRLSALERFPHLSRMIGVPVRGTSDAGALLVSFVRTLWEQLTVSSDSEWADSLDEVIWSLVDLAYAPRKMREPDLTRRESRRRAILAYLEQNLSNSELCAQSIAEGVGICERYVQALFADMGTTPSAYIVDRRLDFIAGQIESRGYRAQITNLAYEVGFNSMSSFCRAFRRKFGMTSKEFRIKHQRQA